MTPKQDAEPPPAEVPPSKILVVDDEPDLEGLMLQRMRREIRSGRYTFVFAHDGIEALECLTRDPDIDMVLSDINMPKMDGLTLLEQIPNVDPNVRSVVVSAYGDMKNIRTAMNRGAFDFVTKPIDFGDLKITIDRTVQHMIMWRDALESRDRLVALQNELDMARRMQQSILPTAFPDGPGYDVSARMEPARDVGGDFFDIVRLDQGRVGLAVADVSDKGVPAALFMMSSRTLLKGAAIGRIAPDKVLGEVNQLLCEANDAAMFVTVCYAIFDPASGELVYGCGGHDSPLVVHADGGSTVLPQTGGVALGVVPELDYRMNTVTLQPGDVALFYTDGVTEAENEAREQFGIERLRQAIAETRPGSAEAAVDAVFGAVKAFAGDAAQHDDITCMTLHRAGAGG